MSVVCEWDAFLEEEMGTPRSAAEPADESSDEKLAISAGGQAVFEAAYRQHRSAVMRLLQRRVGNESDAAELTQEAYLLALRYRGLKPESLKALLLRIAMNLAGTHGRRNRTRHTMAHTSLEDLPIAQDELSQDERLVLQERRELIAIAVQALPPKCRQVFVLSRFHDLPQKEIAQRLGISLSMVEKHITTAMAMIRAKVGELTQERF
jgi:RNA polymerase sigma factor (sigma-70 family)